MMLMTEVVYDDRLTVYDPRMCLGDSQPLI